jgi:hypothetical protein
MAGEPLPILVLLVCCIVVEDHMDRLVRRDFALDPIEEGDELPMAIALNVLADDGFVQHIECGEQRGRAVPLKGGISRFVT